MTMKYIKELRQGDVFYYNGREYKLINHKQYNRNSMAEALDDKSEHIFGDLIGVHLIGKIAKISEFLEDKKNVVDEDKEKISNIAANSPDKKLKLYLGCFNKPIHGFVNVDIRSYPETQCDIVDDILKLEKFEENSIDLILSVHTLEHVGRYEYINALKLWYNKLRNNGEIFISVPDMQAVFEHYIYHHDLEFLYSHIWGSQKHDADWHGHGHDFTTLSKALREAGFKNIERYDCEKMPWSYTDSYAQAYAKFKDANSRLMSLNIRAVKKE